MAETMRRPRAANQRERALRQGNIRNAVRRLAAKEGVKLGKISYERTPYFTDMVGPGSHASGLFWPDTRNINIATIAVHDPIYYGKPPQRPQEEIARDMAHEYAHARGFEHGPEMTLETNRVKQRLVRTARAVDRLRQRKSSGGEVEVRAHERGGVQVSAYARSKPS